MQEGKEARPIDITARVPLEIVYSIGKLDNIYEARLFGWILAKAQAVVKKVDGRLRDINVEYGLDMARVTFPARYMMSTGDKDLRGVRKAFALASKTILTTTDNATYQLNIIAFPKLYIAGGQTYISCVIANEMWHAMLNFHRGWRLVSLPTFLSLKSTNSIIFLLLISQQAKPIRLSVDNIREMFQLKGKPGYTRFFNIKERIIEPSRQELNMKSCWSFDYTMARSGRNRATEVVIITPRPNDPAQDVADPARDAALNRQRVRLNDNVVDYLMKKLDMTVREIEVVEGFLEKVDGWENQIDLIASIMEAAHRNGEVRNVKGYLFNALKNHI